MPTDKDHGSPTGDAGENGNEKIILDSGAGPITSGKTPYGLAPGEELHLRLKHAYLGALENYA